VCFENRLAHTIEYRYIIQNSKLYQFQPLDPMNINKTSNFSLCIFIIDKTCSAFMCLSVVGIILRLHTQL